MRRYLCLIMAVWLTLLVGCGGVPAPTGPHAEPTSEWITAATGTTGMDDTRNTSPSMPGNSLVTYDPDRQIYFACGNQYMDFYEDFTATNYFYIAIYSKKQLNPDAISVQVPIARKYEVMIGESIIPRGTEYSLPSTESGLGLQYYVYQVYRGVDFMDSSGVVNESGVLEEFKNLRGEDLPVFYGYTVLVVLDHSQPYEDEEITYVDITVDGQLYRQDIGRIRLISSKKSLLDYQATVTDWAAVMSLPLYSDGIGYHPLVLQYTAEEDTTVREFKLLGSETEILELTATVTSGGVTMEYQWDGNSVINLYAGDQLELAMVYYNPCIAELDYCILLDAVLGIEIAGEHSGIIFEKLLKSNTNPYEEYAIVFDGLDMEPYYRGYYYENYELWRKKYIR